MGVAVFALIFLSSSYLFLRRWNITRPHAFRWDGHALYFSVVAAALALVVEADLLRVQVELSGPAGAYVTAKLTNLLATFATDKKLETLGATALWSVPIAVASVLILNLPLRLSSFLRTQLYLRMSCLSELEEFLLVTNTRNMPVMVTLSSNKVYIGFSIEAGSSRDEKEWVRLEPLLSGYRNEKHEFIDTTDYAWLHRDTLPIPYRRSDFDILIPASDITSVHAFDLNIYLRHFPTSSGTAFDSPARNSRPPQEPLTKSERFYWAFFVLLSLICPIAYFASWIVVVLVVLLTLLCAGASIIDDRTLLNVSGAE